MHKVVKQRDNDLSRAFEEVLIEIQAGVSRAEAFTAMANRIDVSEVTAFIAAMLECAEKGTRVYDVLRDQLEQLRKKLAIE